MRLTRKRRIFLWFVWAARRGPIVVEARLRETASPGSVPFGCIAQFRSGHGKAGSCPYAKSRSRMVVAHQRRTLSLEAVLARRTDFTVLAVFSGPATRN